MVEDDGGNGLPRNRGDQGTSLWFGESDRGALIVVLALSIPCSLEIAGVGQTNNLKQINNHEVSINSSLSSDSGREH